MAEHAVPVVGFAFVQVTQESNTVPGHDVETQLKNSPMLFVCATHPFSEAPAYFVTAVTVRGAWYQCSCSFRASSVATTQMHANRFCAAVATARCSDCS